MRNIHLKKALIATALSISNLMLVVPLSAMASDATVQVAGRPAFDVLARAGGMSQATRAEMIQKNLDNALIASVNAGSSAAVNVSYQKGMPVLTVGGKYICTVDTASAKAASTTPALLANKWAASLRSALADQASVDTYVAQLTTGERTQAATITDTSSNMAPVPVQPTVVNIPAGLNFPVTLTTSVSSEVAREGDVVTARVDEAINLGNYTITPGTQVTGRVINSEAGRRLFARAGALQVEFNSMQLPTGQVVPIHATIASGISEAQNRNLFSRINANPIGKTAIQGTVGAGLGAALGTAIGAIAGSHGTRGRAVGRGAWSGAAIGGGVGALHALFLSKGSNVVYPSGQRFVLQLDTPAQVAITSQTGLF